MTKAVAVSGLGYKCLSVCVDTHTGLEELTPRHALYQPHRGVLHWAGSSHRAPIVPTNTARDRAASVDWGPLRVRVTQGTFQQLFKPHGV